MPGSTNTRRRLPLLALLGVIGPGIIAASAGNDAGGISTYSVAGADFGYEMLWLIPIMTLSLVVVQEMAVRMGAVTGKGFAALIRERFGIRPSFFAMTALVVSNAATSVSEFAGIASAMEILGVSRYIAVPVAALGVWLVLGALRVSPHYLAYFNQIAGGPGNGYRCLVDSNLDWGQDLKGLKRYMDRNGITSIKLSYFGTVNPRQYGIAYEALPSFVPLPREAGRTPLRKGVGPLSGATTRGPSASISSSCR